MFKDCLEIFNERYQQKGENYILDSYTLSDGTYILVGQDMCIKQVLNVIKSKEEIDKTIDRYEEFVYMDYYSYYLDSNKCIDSSAKLIHSNNYLSFMVKKENIVSGKLTSKHIKQHYNLIAHPEEKYKAKKKSLALYEEVASQLLPIDQEKLHSYEQWIQEHIFNLIEDLNITVQKGYLKIFFEQEDISLYEQESRRYILTNIYNSTDYNVVMNERTYGMPNDNLGLNSKKPYLKHMTRKNTVPYLIDTDEVLLQKKFMDYLRNEFLKGHVNIYLSQGKIQGLDYKSFLTKQECEDKEFNGYFLRIDCNDKGAIVIIDSDHVLHYKVTIEGLDIKRNLPTAYTKNISYGSIDEISILARMIDRCFFKNLLCQSYFGDLPDRVKKEDVLQKVIIRSRDAFFRWFYKGDSRAIQMIFSQLSLELIQKMIGNEEDKGLVGAKEAWLLRDAVISYFKGGTKQMGDLLKEVYEGLEVKVAGEAELTISSDNEYFCAVGQLAYYLLTHNKGNKKTHALLNPILNAKDDTQIKEQLRRLFVKYNYDILQGAGRFNRLYAMITAYKPENKIAQDVLLYGYLQDNLLYKSTKQQDSTEITNEDVQNNQEEA